MSMDSVTWSKNEKEIARAAFDRALERERKAILREVQSMLNNAKDARVIWDLQEYLTRRRREIDQKYDYRYSVLIPVFARLMRESWLTEDDLTGLRADKIKWINELSRIGL